MSEKIISLATLKYQKSAYQPAESRALFVTEMSETHLRGIDAQKGQYRTFNLDRASEIAIIPWEHHGWTADFVKDFLNKKP